MRSQFFHCHCQAFASSYLSIASLTSVSVAILSFRHVEDLSVDALLVVLSDNVEIKTAYCCKWYKLFSALTDEFGKKVLKFAWQIRESIALSSLKSRLVSARRSYRLLRGAVKKYSHFYFVKKLYGFCAACFENGTTLWLREQFPAKEMWKIPKWLLQKDTANSLSSTPCEWSSNIAHQLASTWDGKIKDGSYRSANWKSFLAHRVVRKASLTF